MSKKLTSAKSNEDGEQNEISDSFLQQEYNAKLAKLASLRDTTLQDLPMELLECILIKVVVMEVKGLKLAKSVWKRKAKLVMSRLRTVCPHWSSILTTDFFRNELHRTLDGTAQKTIRLEVLHKSPIPYYVFKVTSTKDELFMMCIEPNIIVYNRNNMTRMNAVIEPPETRLVDVAGCSVSNCVYAAFIADTSRPMSCCSVLRITKNEEQQFIISPWLNGQIMPLSALSVSANGSLIILNNPHALYDVGISIYDANGCCLQHKIALYPGIRGRRFWDNIIQKSNGNLVLVSLNHKSGNKLVEIDAAGKIVRHFRSSLSARSGPYFANAHGRFVIAEENHGIKLLDSELNLLHCTSPHLNGRQLHYNYERNELVSILQFVSNSSVVTVFRFIED